MPPSNLFFSRIQSAPAPDDEHDPFPPPPHTPVDGIPSIPIVLHFGHARTQSNLSSAYTDIPEHTDNESESSVTSISTPPSALANPSPAKLEPPTTLDSDDENEIDVALGPAAFGSTPLRPSSSVPSMNMTKHLPSPARSASCPSFGHGFSFGGRIGMGSVKGKGRLLDGFDTHDPSPSSLRPKASSIWSTGSGGSTGTPERSPRKREHGDRFIPQRDDWDTRLSATYNLSSDPRPPTPRRTPIETDAHKEQQNRTFSTALASEMFPHAPFMPSSSPGSVSGIGIKRRRSPSPAPSTPSRQRILGFSTPGSTPGSVVSDLGLLDASHPAYSPYAVRRRTHAMLTGPQTTIRTISKTPYKVLDAPELKDDFYLNLVDWSSTNLLGVGLGSCVYLWSAENSKVVKLCDLGNVNPVTSVSWVQKGSTVAIGTQNGEILIYDATTLQKQRTLSGHASRVGALAWSNYTLSSGSRDRTILNFDVRLPPASATVSKLYGHRQEICGLKWSAPSDEFVRDPVMLASGGNDNKLFVWDLRHSTPLWKFHEHTAAVKAIAWSPHQSGLLASGGGTADKKIRFWNTSVGAGISEMDTGSQVCNLTWSKTSNELVSTHGYSSTQPQNQVCIWKYPSLSLVATLSGHVHRVLYLAMNPTGDTIVTGAGDETLRFWNAFPKRGEVERRTSEGQGALDEGGKIR
ncbi:putative APC/C activator protein CDC20 (cell division control protein 20) [Rhizoctonia solani 123E]|uniref:Putative APC/C activator protein CDC20 (Cell division control protein 20) n=1 Tax=Rhizoctonia solani 123E TaxID=1423351 RepID=A0A074RY25_9AGAM|nr:putative APC/C activator protein CDC20 (cell division control protein 20) [Rhizoctonia solani 123E]